MRVIAGTARRLPLKTISGTDTRPTTDRIKETLFNILQPKILNCRFLDLFAGSGGIGIEALSRGAAFAAFVEKNPKAAECISKNLRFTRLDQNARLWKMDVFQALRVLESEEPFDCVFLDPPYGQGLERRVLEQLANSSVITEDTLIIVEADLQTDFSYLETLGFETIREKTYKTNVHRFLHRKCEEEHGNSSISRKL